MARSNGSLMKWGAYFLAFLAVFFLESCICNRFPLYGAVPFLSLLAVSAVGTFEGSLHGSVWGLVIGLVCLLTYFRPGGFILFAYSLIGFVSGIFVNQQVGRTYLGFLLSSALGLVIFEGLQIASRRLFTDVTWHTLWHIVLPEAGYTLLLSIPVYLLFRFTYRRLRTDSEL